MNVLERTMRDRYLPEFARVYNVVVHRGDLPDYATIKEEPLCATDLQTGTIVVEDNALVPFTTRHRYDNDVSLEYRRALAADEFPDMWESLSEMLGRIAEWSAFLETTHTADIVRSSYSTEDIRAMAWFLGVPGGIEEQVPRLASAILLTRRVSELLA